MENQNLEKTPSEAREEWEQKLDDFRQELSSLKSSISEGWEKLENELRKLIEEVPRLKPTPAGVSWEELEKVIEEIDRGSKQSEILNSLLRGVGKYCQRVALFVISGQEVVGWLAKGFSAEGVPTGRAKVTLPLAQNNILNEVNTRQSTVIAKPEDQPENDQFLQRLGEALPKQILATPLFVRGKVAAIIYADQGDSLEEITMVPLVEIISKVAGMAIELLPLRRKLAEAPPPPKPPEEAKEEVEEEEKEEVEVAPSPEAITEEDRKIHEEAQRFARLLVSEIRLYNEVEVTLGRKNQNLYQRLKDDIERSRDAYNKRFPTLASTTDYFHEQLVKILAEGDESALGMQEQD